MTDILKTIEKEILKIRPDARFTVKEDSSSKLSIEIHSMVTDEEWVKIEEVVLKYSIDF